MASKYWDERTAEGYRAFRYEFRDRPLAGKTIFVAGGTGGLGAATVARLLREGAQVIVGYGSNRERAKSLKQAMHKQFGVELEMVEGDIAEAETRRKYAEAGKKAGGIEGAAIFPGNAARVKWEELDERAMEASLRANLVGPMLLARELGEMMERSAGGSLVVLATMQAVAVFAGSINYAAPKAALVHAARVMAKQWKKVRVNVVAPGATVAGMAETSVSAGKYDGFVERGTIPRFGRPEDVAQAVRFFLEPDGYATGQVLVVDGGLTARRDG
jgi:NAD(P)-dependent dehydrogenase (short-subunit alcohol dehydrogenase family)